MRRCIESILAQNHTGIELILVDDGSNDGSAVICDEYAERDSRIRVIHKENGGVSSARNAGLSTIRGEYIGFVDSDDWIEPDMYSTMLKKMEEKNVDIVQCGYCTDEGAISGFWRGVREDRYRTAAECLQALVCGNMRFSSLCNKLYRASLFEGISFSTKYRCFEDALVNYQILKRTQGIYIYETCKYHYVRNSASVLSKLEPWRMENIFNFYSDLLDWEKESGLKPYCEKGLVDSCFSLIGGIVREKDCWEQYPVLREVILSYRGKPMYEKLCGRKDSMKMLLIWKCPTVYNLLIRVQHSVAQRRAR